MLHLKTVEPGTLSILEELNALPSLKDFALVGGTVRSLLYGHRMSVDLDLFSTQPFKNEDVIGELRKKFKTDFVMEEKHERFGIFCYLRNIKVDIIRHPHSNIRPISTIENIRMFSTEDIIAMKVQATLGRGKKKDFWDIAELLKHYTLKDFIVFHKEKYSTHNSLITVPSAITYFKDANDNEDPISLQGQTWESVTAFIQAKVREYLI